MTAAGTKNLACERAPGAYQTTRVRASTYCTDETSTYVANESPPPRAVSLAGSRRAATGGDDFPLCPQPLEPVHVWREEVPVLDDDQLLLTLLEAVRGKVWRSAEVHSAVEGPRLSMQKGVRPSTWGV